MLRIMLRCYVLFGVICFILLIIMSANTHAQGNLMLFPKRVVFEGSKKIEKLNLANTGKDTLRYLISLVNCRMNEDGAMEVITDPKDNEQFAEDFIRFYPRSVVLAPNQSQSVKIQLINSDKLSTGEYRSHFYFRAEQEKKPLGEDEIKNTANAISVDIKAIFGITIPVILRTGEPDINIRFKDVRLETSNDSVSALNLTILRTGNMSVFGDITASYISPGGKITPVASVKGVAIYTPNNLRNIKITLNPQANINYQTGKLRISYSTQPDAKSIKLAETEIDLH